MSAPPIDTALATDRAGLRREIRARRRALSAEQRSAAAVAFAHTVDRHRLLRPGMRVAVYFAYGNEADLSAVIDRARRRGCTLYLPAITDYRHHRIEFLRYETGSPLRLNRYGIAEPKLRSAARIAVRHLDLILVPLVAFDARGWRVGSGAGFYDRALHHLRTSRQWRRPRLIGVGYGFQHIARIDPQPWDVPLDGIVTELKLHRPHLAGGR